MAYQLNKTGAQTNTKLQELTVRTLTANGNTASTDGILLLDGTSAAIDLKLIDTDFIVGQRLVVIATNITNDVRIIANGSEVIRGIYWGAVTIDYAYSDSIIRIKAFEQGAMIEIVKISTNLFYIIRNIKWGDT